MAFVITPAGGGGVTFADVIANFDATVNGYWDIVNADGPGYEVQKVGTPGVDGVSIERDGFRERRISAECYIVAATRVACLTALATLDACFNLACSVQVPNGATYPRCEIKPYRILEQPTDTGYGTFMMKVALEFDQAGLT